MNWQKYGIDLTRLYDYFERQYLDPSGAIRTWEEPLSSHLVAERQHELHKIKTADELHRLQPRVWNNLYAKAVLLPIGKWNGGGPAFIVLVMEIAEVLHVTESTGYDILDDLIRFANRRSPIASKASYRNTKGKFSTK